MSNVFFFQRCSYVIACAKKVRKCHMYRRSSDVLRARGKQQAPRPEMHSTSPGNTWLLLWQTVRTRNMDSFFKLFLLVLTARQSSEHMRFSSQLSNGNRFRLTTCVKCKYLHWNEMEDLAGRRAGEPAVLVGGHRIVVMNQPLLVVTARSLAPHLPPWYSSME